MFAIGGELDYFFDKKSREVSRISKSYLSRISKFFGVLYLSRISKFYWSIFPAPLPVIIWGGFNQENPFGTTRVCK